MTDFEKLDVLYKLYQYLDMSDFMPEPNERYSLESIITRKNCSGTFLFADPLVVYKNLLFSHNFLNHFFKTDMLEHAKEMIEHREPLDYINKFIK